MTSAVLSYDNTTTGSSTISRVVLYISRVSFFTSLMNGSFINKPNMQYSLLARQHNILILSSMNQRSVLMTVLMNIVPSNKQMNIVPSNKQTNECSTF